uniref:acyl-coenzyme A thioesterase MBLAC2 n=1 Tax=Myxine glutinosa TaxID=7769 RepID=UPI00358E1FC8
MAKCWFHHEEILPDVFLIREKFFQSGNRANLWLLRGSCTDLLVDTGLGLWSLPEYLNAVGLISTRKPLLAVATHVHFDHAGGMHQFQATAIHRAEVPALEAGDNYEAVTWLSDSEVVQPPHLGWKASDFRLQSTIPSRSLEDGEVLNLGNKQVEVLHTPGHSRGSICLLERSNGLLFSGDTLYAAPLLDWLPYSEVRTLKASCRRLADLVRTGAVYHVLPGHFETFSGEELMRRATAYADGAGLVHSVSASAMRCVARLALRFNN